MVSLCVTAEDGVSNARAQAHVFLCGLGAHGRVLSCVHSRACALARALSCPLSFKGVRATRAHARALSHVRYRARALLIGVARATSTHYDLHMNLLLLPLLPQYKMKPPPSLCFRNPLQFPSLDPGAIQAVSVYGGSSADESGTLM